MGLSTHVLDAVAGEPAAAVRVRLTGPIAAAGVTDGDGRCRLVEGALSPGTYELTFETGAWFNARDTETFYPEVTVTFAVTEPERHCHVPLLLSPYGYSTYRGS